MAPKPFQKADGDKGVDADAGTRSKYYGDVQRERQHWLKNRIRGLSEEDVEYEWFGTQLESAGEEALRATRLSLLERGVQLWNATYVPPIEPVRRQELIDKWSGNAARLETSDHVSCSLSVVTYVA